MNQRLLTVVGMLSVSLAVYSEQSIYCPQNHGYINVGMTKAQVINACGQPLSKQKLNKPVTEKVPIKQLVYNKEGAQSAFYGVWAIPVGQNVKGGNPPFGGDSGGGARLEITIVNNKVSSILLNGSNTNAFNICDGRNVQIGDALSQVYFACGTPSLVNDSYINQAVPSTTQPEVWIYQADQYQSPITLTFVDGKLQSID